ncbi:MAG: Crp/Fnr family transcriptional regulator [Gammaproteobacteria bacterium]|nr:Crp/Fnr family transcriptional regulator [Gammaproteobacteria bacterium]MDH5512450.1 Crp/Fnr family transcriptional regulator [Gammaproteobacteria bacterium]
MRLVRGSLTHCRSDSHKTLFRAGDPSTYLYVIREGQVKLTRKDIYGRDHLLNLAGPGFFLGFDAIGNPAYSYSATTLTPTVFCRIGHGNILRLLNEEPKIALNVLFAVNEQLALARNMIHVLGQKTAVQKLAALLLNLSPPVTGGDSKARTLHLSRHEMAEMLGLTVETVSRIMAELRRRGIIEAPRGSVIIRKRAPLQSLGGDIQRPVRARKSKPPRVATRARHQAVASVV